MSEKNYAVTYLSEDGALYLEIEGKRFEVAHYTASWAVNEIPQAQCLVGVGRNARNAAELAAIHTQADQLKQMRKARVLFRPRGEYTPNGDDWPDGEQVIFDGYYVGYAHRKMNGKVQVIVNLSHWLIDLTQSSCVSKNSHPSNPSSLTAPAVLRQVREAGGSQGAFVSYLTGHRVVQTQVLKDLWGAIKDLFCSLANIEASPVGPSDECGPGSFVKNDRALAALSRIEGPAQDCPTPYKYGVPLVPQSFSQPLVDSAIGNAICNAVVDSYVNTTFWDKLIGEFCPMFQLAVIPLADKALIVADTPTLRTGNWREILPDDYDGFDQTAFVERPLRAVGVYGHVASFTGARNGETPVNHRDVGGCYVARSVAENDGLVQYIRAPAWLDTVMSSAVYGSASTGNKKNQATNTPTTPGKTRKPDDPVYNDQISAVQPLYARYAHSVYVLHTLRGRNGSLSGRLRFDIGPGSIVKVVGTPDRGTEDGIDKLAGDYYACVSRVTVNINAEASLAGTTFQLTHMRTAAENEEPRTSVEEHPLFGRAVHGGGKHGAPLVEAYENLQ